MMRAAGCECETHEMKPSLHFCDSHPGNGGKIKRPQQKTKQILFSIVLGVQ
jgi:hypothetical protein